MQRFTLIHDGSEQGWQTAYLAFHVAAQLGAPVQGLIVDAGSDKDVLEKRASQVEVGGHAAGVAIETQMILEFSVDAVKDHLGEGNGLFVPRRLVPDEETARRFQELFACPLWIVSRRSAAKGVAVLFDMPEEQEAMFRYAAILSHRLKQPLTGFILNDDLARHPLPDIDFFQLLLPDFSISTISTALDRVNASLLILSISQFTLSTKLPLNCVFYPVNKDT